MNKPHSISPPAPPAVNQHAPTANGGNVLVEHGVVQFVGRTPLAIKDDAMNVPLAAVLATAAQIMQLMVTPGPIGDKVREHLNPAGARITRDANGTITPPKTH